MMTRESKLAQIVEQVGAYCTADGIHSTPLEDVRFFRDSVATHQRLPWIYEPMVVIAVQGKKNIYLDGNRYGYHPGQFMALFMPMVVECQLIEASPEYPLLAISIRLDRHRLAKMLLKMDSVEQVPDSIKPRPEEMDVSGIFSAPLNEALLDAILRLLTTLKDAAEAAILGEAIVEEIYYRLLKNEQGGALRVLLRQQGQIQQISKAVDYLHERLDQTVPVEKLAAIAHMSTSGFHKKFKEVMHLSPLQYTKLVRLNRARAYLMEGKSVSEAGYRVGYNSPAQFSREYKRQFGFAPSETTVVTAAITR